jgi:hypothetical protein
MLKTLINFILVITVFFSHTVYSEQRLKEQSRLGKEQTLIVYLPSVTPPALPVDKSISARFHVNVHSRDLTFPVSVALYIDEEKTTDMIANGRSYTSKWELDSFGMTDGACKNIFVIASQNDISAKSEVVEVCVSLFPTEYKPSGPLLIIVDPNTAREYSAKEIIVSFNEGTKSSRIIEIAESVGCEVIHYTPPDPEYFKQGYYELGFNVPLSDTVKLFEVLAELKSLAEVESANPNGIARI